MTFASRFADGRSVRPSKETLVTLARVAERAERYDEMANYMKPLLNEYARLLLLRVVCRVGGNSVTLLVVH